MKLLPWVGLCSVFVSVGCVGGGGGHHDGGIDGGDCQVGSESCDCTSGGACDPGLTCVSEVCVDLSNIGGSGGSGGTAGTAGTAGGGDPAATLNAMVILPNEGAPLMNPTTDDSVTIETTSTETQPLMMGGVANVSLPFSAPNANVIAAGIRFGTTGPIRTVMLPQASGQTNATLAFDMQIPASVCADLANICHDIQCYEFAVTDAGQISRENIMDVALLCGNCDEPTCQDLLPAGSCNMQCLGPEDCDEGETCSMGACVGEGALRFTMTWSASTDLDLYVVTPNGNTLSYSNRSGDSGMLDVDNQSGGSGATENVFFTAPPVGTYTYYVQNYSGSQEASYMLQVFKNGSVAAMQSGSVPASGGAMSAEYTITVP